MEYIREALDSILEEENKKEIDADFYDDDWTQEDEEDDIENYEEDNPITPEQEAFANELRAFLQSLIDEEEQDDDELEEKFTSQQSLTKHFNKHCLANTSNRKSTKSNIYYDFTSVKQYSNYEQKLYNIFRQGVSNSKERYDFIDDIFNVGDVNKKFTKLFEGNFTLFISGIFGLKNSKGTVNLGIRAFSSDVTTNYKGGNTLDICILSPSLKSITLYPVDATTIKREIIRIINKYSSLKLTPSMDDKKLLDSLNNNKSKYLTEGVSRDDPYLDRDYEKAMDTDWKHYIFSVNTKNGWLVDERGSYPDDYSFKKAVAEIERRYGDKLLSINALHDKGLLKYYTDLYNSYLKKKKEEAQSKNKQDIQNTSNNQQSLKNNNNSTNSSTPQNSNSTQNNQQQNNFQQAAKRKNNPVYKQRTKNNSKIVQAFKNNGLPTDKLTQQVVDKNGRKYTRATPILKKLRKDLFGENLKEDLEETSPYTNIKSNGIYSLNTGWVKHPVQQDIPDIDMDEFEKEFKVWEDRYFDLLDELNNDKEFLTEGNLRNINSTITKMLGKYINNITYSPHKDYIIFSTPKKDMYAIPIELLDKYITKDYKKLRYSGDGRILDGEVYDDKNNHIGRAYYGVPYDHVHNNYKDTLIIYKWIQNSIDPNPISFEDFIEGLKNGRY